MKAKLVVGFVFLCAAASLASQLFNLGLREGGYAVSVDVSTLIFLGASIVIFFRPTLGYSLGLAAGLIAAQCLVLTETNLVRITKFNSWLAMNCEAGPSFEASCGPLVTRFKLMAFVFVTVSIACSVLKLLPARGNLRLWPAFAVSFLALAVWFVHSVSPYRLPMFHDYDDPAEPLRILHVEKRGLYFRETCVFGVLRDGKVWTNRADRRWFQYKFDRRTSMGSASPDLRERVQAFVQAAKGWDLHTPPPRALWGWHAEGWYVVTPDRRFSFVGTQPPQEVKALFRDLESPVEVATGGSIRDVCLGFCYDPPAALGFRSLRARKWLLEAE
jgi:hypothetical protein